MDQTRGVLFLSEPFSANAQPQQNRCETLIFDENERQLSSGQEALWRLRRRCGWVCVAADGRAAALAVALAAQLPVDRLALSRSALFSVKQRAPSRNLARLERFARRNLALVASELMLADVADGELAAYLRVLDARRLCVLETGAPREAPWSHCVTLLCAPWERVCQGAALPEEMEGRSPRDGSGGDAQPFN